MNTVPETAGRLATRSAIALLLLLLAGRAPAEAAMDAPPATGAALAAYDDVVSMPENGGPLAIAVLANDQIGAGPGVIVAAGTSGFSDSDPVITLDRLGDPVVWPEGSTRNGQVLIDGDQVIYEPKRYYNGIDTFTYTVRDALGNEATATVTVSVAALNNPPEASGERSFSMREGASLTVPAQSGLLAGSYDPDNALTASDGVPIATQTLRLQLRTPPNVGELQIDERTGAFTFRPPIDFVGEARFSYVITDGASISEPESQVRILVTTAPPAALPPPAGQVAATFNLANFPLEQSTGVPANVLVVMDDSGSMDWHLLIGEAADGRMILRNRKSGSTEAMISEYSYLWALPNRTYPAHSPVARKLCDPTSPLIGLILPTEEALQASANHRDNRYGVWRAWTHRFNRIYYDPSVRYVPWVGQDNRNAALADADPTAIRIDPLDPTQTMNLLVNHEYTAGRVPRWPSGCTDNLAVSTYIPHYYLSAAPLPLAWDSQKTKVEIRPGAGPLPGGLFPGGPKRFDCAGDGEPADCTFEEEIQNFANWFQYYRSRELVAKAGVGRVISQVQDVRVGYETLSELTREPIREMNELHTEGNKKQLLDSLYKVESLGETPLRRALDRAGQVLGCRTGSGGDCPRLPAPAGFCQQNFALMFTDGYWNGAAGVSGNRDADGPGPFDGGRYRDGYSATLADTAMYHYEEDLHPDYPNRVPVAARDLLGAPPGTFDVDAPFMHQHMKTYGIAFGVDGTVDPDSVPLDPTAPFAWPDPYSSSRRKIDDLLHATVNGRGRFLNASNGDELQSALESAFLEFTQVASSTSSAAFNSTSLEEGTLLYRGFYDLRFNTGELTATRVNGDGSLEGSPVWQASAKLDEIAADARVIVSYDRIERHGVAFRPDSLGEEQRATLSEAQVQFLRGARAGESTDDDLRVRQVRNGLLGDIVNSSPVFVGPPRSINRDQAPYPVADLYSVFARERSRRDPMLYVGANDGMLHGFDARTGVERFAYVPNKLIDATLGYRNELGQFTSPFYQHRLFVDLTPRLNDAYVRTPAAPTDKAWRSILIGGLGAGGKGFFALDVTDPDAFANESMARAAVLWEFTDEDDTYPLDADGEPLGGAVGAIRDPLGQPVKDLGYALALPTVAMSNVSAGGSSAPREWVALFGNGPNSTAGIAKLFVLFLDRGIDGWDPGDFIKIDTGFGVPLAPHPLAGFPNALGTPSAVDTNLDGTVDRVYAGDRLGNLFRFDLSDADPNRWTSTRLFTARYTKDGRNSIQPILAQPTVIKHPTETGFLVIFGTGSYVTRDDGGNEDIQSIYAIWDRGERQPATAAANARDVRLVAQTLTNVYDDSAEPGIMRRVFLDTQSVDYRAQNCVTAGCAGADETPGVYGWYVDLDPPRATTSVRGAGVFDASGRAPPGPQYPGERAIRRFVVRNGVIVTTTVLPALDEFSCFGTRPGAVLVMDAATGGDVGKPFIDFNRDRVIDERDLLAIDGERFSGGLLMNQEALSGQLVDLSTLGGSDGMDFLFVSGGRDTLAFRIEGIADRRTGRLSWRELDFVD